MKKSIFYILALVLLFNHLSGMEDKNQKPNKESHKYLLIDKSLKDYLIAEIVKNNLINLEGIINSERLTNEIKEMLISETGMQNPYVIIKYLSNYFREDKDKALNFFTSLNICTQKRMLKRMVKLLLYDPNHIPNYFDNSDWEQTQKNELIILSEVIEYFLNTIELSNEQFPSETNATFDVIKNALVTKNPEEIARIESTLNQEQKNRLLEFLIYKPLTESFFDYGFRILYQSFNNNRFELVFNLIIKSNILKLPQSALSTFEYDLLDYIGQICPQGLQAIFNYSHQICKLHSRLSLIFCLYEMLLHKFCIEICGGLSLDDENIFENAQAKYSEFIISLKDLSAKRNLNISIDNETLRLFRKLIHEINGGRDLFPYAWNQQITWEGEINAAKVLGKLIRHIKNKNLVSAGSVERLIRLCASELYIRKADNAFFTPEELQPQIEVIVYKNLAEQENLLN